MLHIKNMSTTSKLPELLKMSSTDQQLLELFKTVDIDNSGFIGVDEVTNMCIKFGATETDAIEIFDKLDRDADGKVSFEDFAAGFDDYEKGVLINHEKGPLSPTPITPKGPTPTLSVTQDNGHDDKSKIQTPIMDANSLCNDSGQFIQELIDNVNKLKEENQRLAQSWFNDKKVHEKLAEEMDCHVQEVELRVKKRAKEELEAERKSIRGLMKDELDELQAHLSMFQKVDNWMKENQSLNKNDEKLIEFQTKLEEALNENRQMRYSMLDKETTIALMRSDLIQLKSSYEDKCKELLLEREKMIQDQEHLSRQISVLVDANRRLQDSNDSKEEAQLLSLSSIGSDHSSINSNPIVPMAGVVPSTCIPCPLLKRGSIIGDYLEPDGRSKSGRQQLNLRSSSASRRQQKQKICEESDAESEGSSSTEIVSKVSKFKGSKIRHRNKKLIDRNDSGISSSVNKSHSFDSINNNKIQGHVQGQRSKSNFGRTPSVNESIKSMDDQILLSNNNNNLDNDDEMVIVSNKVTGPPDRTFKVIFCGDSSVGKSSFIIRITSESFVPSLSSTLGIDFNVMSMNVNGSNVALQLWDTAGQERFRSITRTYYRKVDGICLLYDVSNEASFMNVRNWISDIEEQTSNHCSKSSGECIKVPMIVIGNKIDLRNGASEDRKKYFVSTQQGLQLAKEFQASFIETSVKDDVNINESLGHLVVKMMANEDNLIKISGLTLTGHEKFKWFKCCSK